MVAFRHNCKHFLSSYTEVVAIIWVTKRYDSVTWSVTSGFLVKFFKIEIYPFLVFNGTAHFWDTCATCGRFNLYVYSNMPIVRFVYFS